MKFVVTGALVGSPLLPIGGQPAGAETVAVSCTGIRSIITLNPATGSGNAKYTKWVTKDSDGTKVSLLGSPILADTQACTIDAGIRTNQPGQDVKYLLDDQTNGAAILTTSGALAKSVLSVTGSGTCRAGDPLLNTTYPAAYPLQGKVITKFDQLNASSVQIQMQSYIRLGSDPLDTDGDVTVTGLVIKGPALGGDCQGHVGALPDQQREEPEPRRLHRRQRFVGRQRGDRRNVTPPVRRLRRRNRHRPVDSHHPVALSRGATVGDGGGTALALSGARVQA